MSEAPFTQGSRPVGRTVTVRAPAKVNLHLEVLRRRHDGYHEIETVLQAVALFDTLRVTLHEQRRGGAPRLDLVVGGDSTVPADSTNLAWRAVRHFCRETGLSGRFSLHLDKEIPAAAGLGGGSADAAAALLACDRLLETGLEPARLEKLGSALGSDVPFFIRGGTQLGRGRGPLLSPLPTVRTGQFLIAKPPFELSTSDVYGRLKMGLTVHSPAANIQVLKPILARFPQKTWPGYNRLEEVVLPEQPALQRLVMSMQKLAPVAMLSGSGSAVVGVFPDGQDLAAIRDEFEQAGLWVKIVRPHAAGVGFMEG